MPPSPRRPRSAMSPAMRGSPDLSGFIVTRPVLPQACSCDLTKILESGNFSAFATQSRGHRPGQAALPSVAGPAGCGRRPQTIQEPTSPLPEPSDRAGCQCGMRGAGSAWDAGIEDTGSLQALTEFFTQRLCHRKQVCAACAGRRLRYCRSFGVDGERPDPVRACGGEAYRSRKPRPRSPCRRKESAQRLPVLQ